MNSAERAFQAAIDAAYIAHCIYARARRLDAAASVGETVAPQAADSHALAGAPKNRAGRVLDRAGVFPAHK